MNILKDIIKSAVPASVGSVFFLLLETINLVFIGHLNDPVKLAAVGMGNIIINMCAVGPYVGINSSLETLVSQAYGANNMRLCGVYLQRGRVMNLVMYIPIFMLLIFSGQILRMLG